ncbi:MAG: MarR family winged helix-turn-helix transcriptional regulator, partial [Cellulosilyticaceae bacterium]
MQGTVKIVNELLVELFNEILTIEKAALQSGPFKDLSITEMHVIEEIGLTPRTMTEVADRVGVTVGTLTTSINRLVKKEYVTRNRSKEDRRFVEIELTRRGKLAYRVHEAFHNEMVEYMIEELSNEDHQILIASLTRVSEFFNKKYHLTK